MFTKNKKKYYFIIIIVITLTFFIITCKEKRLKDKEEIDLFSLQNLQNTTIFFGHQSVGINILNGLKDIAEEYNKKIYIYSNNENNYKAKHFIIEKKIGKNLFPNSKVTDFSNTIKSGLHRSIDIALMKFCYVDIFGDISIEEMFNKYISVMEELEKEFPDITFIYVTMPLTSPMKGFKNEIKRILGRLIQVDNGLSENVIRYKFNTMLRNSKASTNRLFDLALKEAEKPDGSTYTIEVDGKEVEALYSVYTWDGGHLNEIGRKKIAEDLIEFLSNLQ